jgi:hypothetical protein
MNKKHLLKTVNILLALGFILTATGGIIRYFAPALMPYDIFRLVHPLFGLFFVAAAIMHITLNFSWIKSTYLHKK